MFFQWKIFPVPHSTFVYHMLFPFRSHNIKCETSLILVVRFLQCLNDSSGSVLSPLLGQVPSGHLQFFHVDFSQHQDALLSSLPICSLPSRLKFDCSCRFRNAFCDVFNADLSHHIFGSFKAFHNHSSESTFITFCFWPEADLLLRCHFPFVPGVFYASIRANDRLNVERDNSLPLCSLLPN